jgi:hypothetical protein
MELATGQPAHNPFDPNAPYTGFPLGDINHVRQYDVDGFKIVWANKEYSVGHQKPGLILNDDKSNVVNMPLENQMLVDFVYGNDKFILLQMGRTPVLLDKESRTINRLDTLLLNLLKKSYAKNGENVESDSESSNPSKFSLFLSLFNKERVLFVKYNSKCLVFRAHQKNHYNNEGSFECVNVLENSEVKEFISAKGYGNYFIAKYDLGYIAQSFPDALNKKKTHVCSKKILPVDDTRFGVLADFKDSQGIYIFDSNKLESNEAETLYFCANANNIVKIHLCKNGAGIFGRSTGELSIVRENHTTPYQCFNNEITEIVLSPNEDYLIVRDSKNNIKVYQSNKENPSLYDQWPYREIGSLSIDPKFECILIQDEKEFILYNNKEGSDRIRFDSFRDNKTRVDETKVDTMQKDKAKLIQEYAKQTQKLEEKMAQIKNVQDKPNVPAIGFLPSEIKEQSALVRRDLAKKIQDIEYFRAFFEDEDVCVRRYLAKNPNLPDEMMPDLASDDDNLVRKYLAVHPKLSEESFELLINDDEVKVRKALAMRLDIPEDLRKELLEDYNDEVKKAAYRPGDPEEKAENEDEDEDDEEEDYDEDEDEEEEEEEDEEDDAALSVEEFYEDYNSKDICFDAEYDTNDACLYLRNKNAPEVNKLIARVYRSDRLGELVIELLEIPELYENVKDDIIILLNEWSDKEVLKASFSNNSLVEIGKDVGYRLAARNLTRASKEAIVKSLNFTNSEQLQTLSFFLDNEVGKALIGLLVSFGLPYIPGVQGPQILRLSKEMEIEALTDMGDFLIKGILSELVPVVLAALAEMSKKEESEVFINQDSKENVA